MVGPQEIVTEGLACGYRGRAVVQDVNLHLPAGRVSCILGKSGCGKSTLLRTLLLLEPAIAGTVRFGGTDLRGLDRKGLDDLRARIGVLFQGAALFNSMTLLDNAAFPLIEKMALPRELAQDLALVKLDLVGLAPFAHYLPAAVSGGMRKRCGIARALALDPPFLFLDEPSAGLDPVTSAEIDALVMGIRDTLGTTVVVVTHELRSIESIGDHLVLLASGGVAAQGAAEDVRRSSHTDVRDFFDRLPSTPPATRDDHGLSSLLLPTEE